MKRIDTQDRFVARKITVGRVQDSKFRESLVRAGYRFSDVVEVAMQRGSLIVRAMPSAFQWSDDIHARNLGAE